MMRELRHEIVVVGGGPAGSAAAIRLAALGHDVCLIERLAFPRHHVGEGLSPGVRRQLEFLGVDAGEAAFLRTPEARVRWGTERGVSRPSHPDAATVDRGQFDQVLLRAAERSGVRVVQPAAARRVVRSASGWTVECDTILIRAAFLIDAAGRAGCLPRRRVKTGPSTVAVYGYWQGAGLPEVPHIEAAPRHWLWCSPVPGGRFNVMVFMDAMDLKRRGPSLATGYRELIARSRIFSRMRQATLASRVYACDATCYRDALAAGDGYLKVGEASFAIDPLSSTGVQKAIQTGLVASIVAHTALLRPPAAGLARQFYLEDQRHACAQHALWSTHSYAENTRHADQEFWSRRAAAVAPKNAEVRLLRWSQSARVRLSRRVSVRMTPCIVGDFVESRLAVVHPSLDRPVAFVAETDLSQILGQIRPGAAMREVEQDLARRLPPETAVRLLHWLAQHDIVQLDAPQ
jgi:flavin-dependent dehydrogenase